MLPRTHYVFVGAGQKLTLPDVAHLLASPTPVPPDAPDLTDDDWSMLEDGWPPPDRVSVTGSEVRAFFGEDCVRVSQPQGPEHDDEIADASREPYSLGIAEVLWHPRAILCVWLEPDRESTTERGWWEDNPVWHVLDSLGWQLRPALVIVHMGDAPGQLWSRLSRPMSLMDDNDFVGYAHRHVPRCLAGLHPEPLRSPPAGMRFRPETAYFAVGCPCGQRAVYPWAHHTTTDDREPIAVSPIGMECPACGRTSELFDVRKHGSAGEDTPGESDGLLAARGRWARCPCPDCGEVPLTLMPGFGYGNAPLLGVKRRPEDFFGVFWLDGLCSRCGWVCEMPGGFECS